MKRETEFKYSMGAHISIKESSESGTIIGRAEYDHSDNTYLVRYCGRDGSAVETWWTESALEAA